jgi:hypothetical protein
VAFANSVMGLVTLVFGALGIVAQFYGIRTLVAALVALAVAGAAVSRLLPEASNQGDARPENKL